MSAGLSLADNINVSGMTIKRSYGEWPKNNLGLSLANVTTPELNETELGCTPETISMSEKGTGADLRLSVPIVSYQKEKEKCVEREHNSECLDRVNTSVARLSEDEIDVHLRIEIMLNKNQSVAQHSRRVIKLTETLAKCGDEISDELSENAWVSQRLNENAITIFYTMEEIVLETVAKVMWGVGEQNAQRMKLKLKEQAGTELGQA